MACRKSFAAFGRETGVESALGAPKLELMSERIAQRAKETGKTPEQVRDEGLAGMEHWLVPLVGPATAAALLGRELKQTPEGYPYYQATPSEP